MTSAHGRLPRLDYGALRGRLAVRLAVGRQWHASSITYRANTLAQEHSVNHTLPLSSQAGKKELIVLITCDCNFQSGVGIRSACQLHERRDGFQEQLWQVNERLTYWRFRQGPGHTCASVLRSGSRPCKKADKVRAPSSTTPQISRADGNTTGCNDFMPATSARSL